MIQDEQELGCADGYVNLGGSYYYGEGVEIDKTKAKLYLELAAMSGDVMATIWMMCLLVRLFAWNRAVSIKKCMPSPKIGC